MTQRDIRKVAVIGAGTMGPGMAATFAVNALGLPAVAVPVGTAGGTPLAVQIIGQPYREDLCLSAAAAIEQAMGVITPIDPR